MDQGFSSLNKVVESLESFIGATAEETTVLDRGGNPDYRESEEKVNLVLSTWERDAIIDSIEKSIEKMMLILRKNDPRNNTTVSNSTNFVPTDVRYLEFIRSRLLYTSEERALRDIETKSIFNKLKNDSAFVSNVLENTAEEIRRVGKFSSLIASPFSKTGEFSVMSKARENLESLKRLREIISHERLSNEIEEKETEKKLAAAAREFEARSSEGESSIAYVFAWEEARCEQNLARCQIAEEELRRTIERLRIEEENEERVSAEISTFLRHNIAENEEEIFKWNNRYDLELVHYSREIGSLEKKIKLIKESLERLLEEQRVKQLFIDSYLAEKEADRLKREREEQVRISTIKIQSWWRGVMVRRKLGRYRPEEKKKKRTPKTKK